MHAGDRRDPRLGLGQFRLDLVAAGTRYLQAQKARHKSQGVCHAVVHFREQRLRTLLALADFLIGLRLGSPQLGIGDGLFDGARQQRQEVVADRLDHIVGGARLDRLNCDLGLVGARDIDDREIDTAFAHLRKHLVTGPAAKIVVEHDDVEGFAMHEFERNGRSLGMGHFVPHPTQVLLHQPRDGRVVVNIEDAEAHRPRPAVMGFA